MINSKCSERIKNAYFAEVLAVARFIAVTGIFVDGPGWPSVERTRERQRYQRDRKTGSAGAHPLLIFSVQVPDLQGIPDGLKVQRLDQTLNFLRWEVVINERKKVKAKEIWHFYVQRIEDRWRESGWRVWCSRHGHRNGWP